MGEDVLAAHNPKVCCKADPVVVLCEAQNSYLYSNHTHMVALDMQASPGSPTGQVGSMVSLQGIPPVEETPVQRIGGKNGTVNIP